MNLSLKFVPSNGSCDPQQLRTIATEELLEQLRCALVDMKKTKEEPPGLEAMRSRAIANLTF